VGGVLCICFVSERLSKAERNPSVLAVDFRSPIPWFTEFFSEQGLSYDCAFWNEDIVRVDAGIWRRYEIYKEAGSCRTWVQVEWDNAEIQNRSAKFTFTVVMMIPTSFRPSQANMCIDVKGSFQFCPRFFRGRWDSRKDRVPEFVLWLYYEIKSMNFDL
jgi:hypothetical protein